jgi:hypothetical protein
MLPLITDIGAYIKALINILSTAATAEVDGAAIQLIGPGYDYQSAVISVAVGTPSGSPTSFSVAANIQDSPDGSTSWADFNLPSGQITPIAAANGQATAKINVRGSRGFIRAKAVPTFVGGTSPAIPIAATVVLGGTTEHPAI